MAFWQIPPPHLAADPPVVELAAAGVWPLELDATRDLAPGQQVRAGRATLTDLATNETAGVPVRVRGNVLVATVQGLVAGRDYKLAWTMAISPRNQPTRITVIRCIA